MNIVLLFSHILTDPQEKELKERYRCENIIYMPEELKKIWMNVDDTTSAEPFKNFLLKNLNKGDYVLIQGEWGLTFQLVNFALDNGFVPLFSRTTRDVKEEKKGDEVVRISVFRHLGFRKYER